MDLSHSNANPFTVTHFAMFQFNFTSNDNSEQIVAFSFERQPAKQ